MGKKSTLPPEFRKLALEIARDSIVTKALARLLEQVIEEILKDKHK
jgi:hypothetical protein